MIGEAAELDGGDVVLEVGGGLGVLSEFLAPRVAHLHVVEVDRSLEEPLRDALGSFDNATLHLADAVKMDFAQLEPAPTKVVANLPYGVAATVLLKSVAELPGAELWVAMVQREVGDRLAAAPGGKSYGATSVIAQLSCEVRVLRKVPRTVFHPGAERGLGAGRDAPPRAGPAPAADRAGARRVRAPAEGPRRLAGSDARRAATTSATPPEPRSSRSATRRTRAPSGCRRRTGRGSPTRSATSASPSSGRARRTPTLGPVLRELAYAKLNLVLHVGRRRDDGMHPVCTLVASIDLADEVLAEPRESGEDTVECEGVPGDNLAARALAEFRSRAGKELPPLAITIRKRVPVAAGLGGGSADAAAALRIANQLARQPPGS